MTLRPDRTLSDARWVQRLTLLVVSLALRGSCSDSNGPRTGKLSITVSGIPDGVSAQVTLSGPNNYTRVLTGSDVVASLKPGDTRRAASTGRRRVPASGHADGHDVVERSRRSGGRYVVGAVLTVASTACRPARSRPSASAALTGSIRPYGVHHVSRRDPGFYRVIAPEIVADQQRFAASPARQAQPGTHADDRAVRYAQTTGNLTFAVNGCRQMQRRTSA
jgi:hypothetical protein